MGKKCPQKIVKFYFCLKHPKMTTADVEDEVVSALVLNSMCLSPKNRKCPFIPRIAIFPELPFYFPEVLFCFPEVSFYLMCVFQMVFFQGDCTFYLSCSELLRETIIALLLKPLHGVWFLMHFIQILFSMIVAWNMQFLRI